MASVISRLRAVLQARSPARAAVHSYPWIVAQARHPALYQQAGVPDTPNGRLECLVAHAALVLRAVRSTGEPGAGRFCQRLFDHLVIDLEHNLTEMGAGDSTLSKRMNKLQAVMTGRLRAIEGALDTADDDTPASRITALAPVVARTVLSADEELMGEETESEETESADPDLAEAGVGEAAPDPTLLATHLVALLGELEAGGAKALLMGTPAEAPAD